MRWGRERREVWECRGGKEIVRPRRNWLSLLPDSLCSNPVSGFGSVNILSREVSAYSDIQQRMRSEPIRFPP